MHNSTEMENRQMRSVPLCPGGWKLIVLLCFLSATFSPEIKAQENEAADSSYSYPLFESDEALEITMEMDMRRVLRDRGDETDYHPLLVTWNSEDGEVRQVEARVKVRGNFRRQRENCRFPPLRMRFEKETVEGTVFEGQKKLKLVTHCQTRRSQYQQYVLQEYLIYRAYSLLTDKSFRVRLVKVTYVDSEKRDEPFTRYNFILEDEDKMAERLGGRIVEVENVHPDVTDYDLSNRLAIFQYMMGNTDWSIPALHNIKLVLPIGGQTPYAIPYDFDWSGIINTRYAEPNPILNIRTVRQRLFRGFCRSPEVFRAEFSFFNRHKSAIYALYRDLTPPLEQDEFEQATEYLDDFYAIINDPDEAEDEIIDECRTDR
ncbi:hypothetical protein G3570_12165 [Balneolaceae bacterium YR4-1]|uniref:Uncharacterized protein n=1 Tax=Halalkalibaculum roseum TaxID=2709311 RepID=A0A6M1TB62_9BACT|nr:hypothetical protein [Halalkalibaculum roseum]NGP77393.1 hypothetical protein [Halalkalibaculum roseum]